MDYTTIIILIVFIALMFLMHRSGGGCCGSGHSHGRKKEKTGDGKDGNGHKSC